MFIIHQGPVFFTRTSCTILNRKLKIHDQYDMNYMNNRLLQSVVIDASSLCICDVASLKGSLYMMTNLSLKFTLLEHILSFKMTPYTFAIDQCNQVL